VAAPPIATGNPRILLVTKGLDLGGIERIVVDLALGLAARGIAVEVAVVNSDRGRLIPPLEAGGIVVHCLDGTDLIGVRASVRLVRLIRGGRFDVVHVHGPLPAVVARLGALGAHPRVVTTSHTPWSSLRRITRTGWRATARFDAATMAVSSAVAASLPASVRATTTVVPHGIDPIRIAAARTGARAARPPQGAGPITVTTVASHREAKNYPNLLCAIRRAIDDGADLRLVSIGDGPALDAHVELARTLGLADIVAFTPATEDSLRLVAGADILVVASDYEGQPIVVAEALALGIPVVATAVGRVSEMVDASVGRVVPPRDPVALAAALNELATAPSLRAQLADNAWQRPDGRTIADVIDDHLTIYRSIVR
jgi:glycosyltransferase involved in cell wall biosynthesis